MTNVQACKRLQLEMTRLDFEELQSMGVFIKFDEANLQKAWIAIEGPPKTPYFGGYFSFALNFPDDYPFSPPRVKFLNPHSKIRFNPNLYVDGKVCLSILGTWSGPPWEPLMNTKTVALSLLGHIFQNEHPIQNEPGYEKKKDPLYNELLGFASLAYARASSVAKEVFAWCSEREAKAMPDIRKHVCELAAAQRKARTVTSFGSYSGILIDYQRIQARFAEA